MDYDDDHVDSEIVDRHILVGKDVEDVYMVQFYNLQAHSVNLNQFNFQRYIDLDNYQTIFL